MPKKEVNINKKLLNIISKSKSNKKSIRKNNKKAKKSKFNMFIRFN